MSTPLASSQSCPEPGLIILLGVPFHDVTMRETLDYMDGMIASGKPGYLATANLDFTAQASQDVELQRILFDAELVLCDGTPLVWASRWLGAPLRERVAGSDLMPHLFAHAEQKGHRLYFLGSTDEVLKTAIDKCAAQYPKLVICGSYAPAYAKLLEFDNEEISRRVKEAKPDILLVAMGCPKQEKWIYMNYRKLGIPVCIGIGASLDFIAGKFRRAPVWMRVCGLEWVFRLMQEPRRLFNRYLIDLLFFVRGLRSQRRLLALGGSGPAEAKRGELVLSQNVGQYKWTGRIDAAAVQEKTIEALLPEPEFRNVLLDCSGVTFIDSTGLGLFIKSFRQCKAAGGTFILFQPSPTVVQMLSAMQLDRLIPISRSEEETLYLLKTNAPSRADSSLTNPGSKALTVSLSGEITSATVQECERTITTSWDQVPAVTILNLDLERVSFIDSSGLGLLIKIMKRIKQRPDGSLHILNPALNVRNVIQLANLKTVLGLTGEAQKE
ncbi:MAG: WecB/TagA/CpsF family glycosyltransferase [Verrucomicrobiota bacterium]